MKRCELLITDVPVSVITAACTTHCLLQSFGGCPSFKTDALFRFFVPTLVRCSLFYRPSSVRVYACETKTVHQKQEHLTKITLSNFDLLVKNFLKLLTPPDCTLPAIL